MLVSIHPIGPNGSIGWIEKRLLPIGELEAALNGAVSKMTINRYVRAGLLTPTEVTPGSHRRWDLEDFRRQMAALHKRFE